MSFACLFVVVVMLLACEGAEHPGAKPADAKPAGADAVSKAGHPDSVPSKAPPLAPQVEQLPEVVREVDMQPWTPCVETSRVVGDRFKTPWGITLGDVQKAALGSHRTPLTWRRDEELSYGAEGTRTTLLVEITRRGAATFVERSGAMRSEDRPDGCRSHWPVT